MALLLPSGLDAKITAGLFPGNHYENSLKNACSILEIRSFHNRFDVAVYGNINSIVRTFAGVVTMSYFL